MFNLTGKIAIVTGAGSGIGEAIATAFTEAGAQVHILDRDPASGARVAAKLKAARFTQVDVADESAVNAAKQKHMRAIARYYCSSRDTTGLTIRFDIVAIVLAPPAQPKIKHIVAAF